MKGFSGYRHLFCAYPKELAYAMMHGVFSGLGQTFLIALFMPSLTSHFDLDNTQIGSLYAGATLISALLVPFLGGGIDRMHLRKFSLLVGSVLSLGWLGLGIAPSAAFVFVAFICIRLGGQSLMSHTAQTAVARYFTQERGKALAIGGLGHPLGEAVLPILIVGGLTLLTWQQVAFALALACIVVFMPLVVFLLPFSNPFMNYPRLIKEQNAPEGQIKTIHPPVSGASRAQVLRSPFFYLVLPMCLTPPFLATGYFLYQTKIAQLNGWSLSWVAFCFTFFALSRIPAGFLAGAAIDRVSACALIPTGLIPMLFSLLSLQYVKSPWAALIYLTLFGLSIGWQSTLISALWSEAFGNRNLGSIRSMVTPLVIGSTAVAPPLFGAYFDQFQSLDALNLLSMLLIVSAIGLSFMAVIYFKTHPHRFIWNAAASIDEQILSNRMSS